MHREKKKRGSLFGTPIKLFNPKIQSRRMTSVDG